MATTKRALINLEVRNDLFKREFKLGIDQAGHGYCCQNDGNSHYMTYMSFNEIIKIRDEILKNPTIVSRYCWGLEGEDINILPGGVIEGYRWIE